MFVAELHRASAQRGRLDPCYQDLSDHWTRILQRLYPVWALIGPGLSDPGHIELRSRTIYLDSDELLGPREQIPAGRLEPRAVLGCFGVALHETFHAKHTKRWALEHDLALADSADPAERQLAVDRRLLEEPRMEAHGVREFPAASVRGRFVRRALEAAVVDVILLRCSPSSCPRRARRPAADPRHGRARVRLPAGAHALRDRRPRACSPRCATIWRQALGDARPAALEELFARVIWIADGELDALDAAARAYRAIVGAPDPPQAAEGDGPVRRSAAGAPVRRAARGRGRRRAAAERRIAGRRDRARARARARRTARAARRGRRPRPLLEQARDPARPTAARRGVGDRPAERADARPRRRPPAVPGRDPAGAPLRHPAAPGDDPGHAPDRQAHPRRALRRARLRARPGAARQRPARQQPPVADHAPGPRADRGAARRAGDRHLRLDGRLRGRARADRWILTDGLRQIGGRCATALFGNGAELLADGAARCRSCPGSRPAAGRRSPATRSSSSASRWR